MHFANKTKKGNSIFRNNFFLKKRKNTLFKGSRQFVQMSIMRHERNNDDYIKCNCIN